MSNNLWRTVKPGRKVPDEINVVVEVPLHSSNKFEYDEKDGYFKLDRALYSALYYPFEYGFIPGTLSDDGDALDAMLLVTHPTFSGCVVQARPIGLLRMRDEKGVDDKVLAVPVSKVDPRFKEMHDVNDLPKHVKQEITLFMEDHKKLEPGKFVKIERWGKAKDAKREITEAIKKFKKEFE